MEGEGGGFSIFFHLVYGAVVNDDVHTRMSVISEHTLDLNKQKCDFYTQNVIFTRRV
jgi:hypothetical protein